MDLYVLTTWLWCGWSLFVLSLEMQLQAGQGEDDLAVVIVFLGLGSAAAARSSCSLYRIGGDLPLAFQHGESIHSCWWEENGGSINLVSALFLINLPSISLLAKA